MRLCALLGICIVLALISSALVQRPEFRRISPAVWQLRQGATPTTITEQQPIPAIASTPQLAVPRWFIYVGAMASLVVAAIMLCARRTALRCRYPRHVPLWRAQVLPAKSMRGTAETPDDRDRPYPPPSAPR